MAKPAQRAGKDAPGYRDAGSGQRLDADEPPCAVLTTKQ
ncbi:hypothetical protein D8I24_4449 [Cupriavidus necator H850]|nr:hypothetical protein D8I24_4449 [Cupriavidus necator H850]